MKSRPYIEKVKRQRTVTIEYLVWPVDSGEIISALRKELGIEPSRPLFTEWNIEPIYNRDDEMNGSMSPRISGYRVLGLKLSAQREEII